MHFKDELEFTGRNSKSIRCFLSEICIFKWNPSSSDTYPLWKLFSHQRHDEGRLPHLGCRNSEALHKNKKNTLHIIVEIWIEI